MWLCGYLHCYVILWIPTLLCDFVDTYTVMWLCGYLQLCDFVDTYTVMWLCGYLHCYVTLWIPTLLCDFVDTYSYVILWIPTLLCDFVDTYTGMWLCGYLHCNEKNSKDNLYNVTMDHTKFTFKIYTYFFWSTNWQLIIVVSFMGIKIGSNFIHIQLHLKTANVHSTWQYK